MKYTARISSDGTKVTIDVEDREHHDCKEIINVCNNFGKVTSVTDKDDENPVFETSHVNNR